MVMLTALNKTFLFKIIFLSLVLCSAFCQRTFYFQDENIRFCTFFQQLDQVTLIPAANTYITANQTPTTFIKPTDFIDNIVNTQMALCGFSLQNQFNFQYNVSVVYSSGQFKFVLQVFNQTKLNYISFYVILYTTKAVTYFQSRSLCLKCQILSANPNKNRTQQLNITMATNRTLGSNFYVKPFIKSMKTREGGSGYTRLQATYAYWDMYTTKLVVNLNTYESLVEEACVTVVALSSVVIGINYTYFISDVTIREFAAASLKSLPLNFGISDVYGPVFNRKCLIGFSFLYFRDGIKQIYFDTTKNGIQSITQNTPQYFYAEMTDYCVTRQRACNLNQGIQTGLQECVNCSLMIKNCMYCLTEAECTACANGYFIDKGKKCCPSYLTNCSVCSQSNVCAQCVDGFFVSDTGTCNLCSNAILNCLRCANSSFCYQCSNGYGLVGFSSCNSTSSSGANSTNTTNQTNQTTNGNTNGSTNGNGTVVPNNNSSESGLSLWMILFIAVASALALVFLIIAVVCFIWRRNKKANKGNENQMNPNENPNNVGQSPNQPNEEVATDMVPGIISMYNNGMTAKITSQNPSSEYINEENVRPGSGMAIRQGSRLNSNFIHFLNSVAPNDKKSEIPTKDIISIQTAKDQSSMRDQSKFNKHSDLQKPQESLKIKSKDVIQQGPQTERAFVKKDSSFLPQVSKTTAKQGGSIHLKANYYK